MPRGNRSDVRSLVSSLRSDAEDIANAVDAGMPEASNAALSRLHGHIREVEHAASLNGHLAAVPSGLDTPPAAAIEAEEAVLGAMLISPVAVKSASAELRPEQFYRRSHRILYEAMITLDGVGSVVDLITLVDYLEQHALIGEIDAAAPGGPEGKERIREIAAIVPAATRVAHYARIVRRAALERNLQLAIKTQPRDTDAIAEAASALTREQVAGDPRRALDAADWLEAQPEGCPAVWGMSDNVLWAEGEPLMLYGPDGVGKTSLAQQVVLHLCGVRQDVLLDLPVRRAERPVLYLACDRPRQARRSLYRMLSADERELLRGRLLIWEGPLPFTIHQSPRSLLEFCLLHDAGTLVVDSLKDVTVELTKPEVALKINQAFQWLNANAIELLVLHHPRKDPAGTPEKPKSLEDVYGDRNFVAGMGSVVLLWGKGGDPIVELRHLKQPAGEYGPLKLLHDHDAGRTVLYEFSTIGEILAESSKPLTVPEVAERFFGNSVPTKNELEKTRRQLRRLVSEQFAFEIKDDATGALSFRAR